MNRPTVDEYASWYQKYVETVDNDVIGELETQASAFPEFIRSVPPDKAGFAYAEGKWTVKELIGHVIDTERVMAYRTLRFSRNDKTPIPGFDENEYVSNTSFHERDLDELAEEFHLLRRANMHLFRSLSEEQINRRGIANGREMSVKALLFVMAGHVNHHRRILMDRYL